MYDQENVVGYINIYFFHFLILTLKLTMNLGEKAHLKLQVLWSPARSMGYAKLVLHIVVSPTSYNLSLK